MKITKTQIRKIIKEELSNVLNEAVQEADLADLYVTTRNPFLAAVRDMATITQKTGNLEQALEQIEANLDAGKYKVEELRRALSQGKTIIAGVYVVTRDMFFTIMADAGEAAMEGMSPDEVAVKIEKNVDRGNYRDPSLRKKLSRMYGM
jgi:hypothetical protein|tara:strand:+ start:683 stop:1129 length:447 start_codon:yes stop_codon:yes gene_type:complete